MFINLFLLCLQLIKLTLNFYTNIINMKTITGSFTESGEKIIIALE